MLGNYIKIAVRNIFKYKTYSAINILGLAVGFACAFLIVVYVQHELSFDSFNSKSDRIYRLLQHDTEDTEVYSALSSSGYAPRLINDFPEIEKAVRLFTTSSSANLKYNDVSRNVSDFIYADESFLEVFDYKLISGNKSEVLNTPNKVLMTIESAHSWFGDEDPVGKSITLLRGSIEINLIVSGVLDEIPSNSHLQFDYVASFPTIKPFMGENSLDDFINYNYYTYLLLHNNASKENIESASIDFLRRHVGEDSAEDTELVLQPLSDIHLNNNIKWNVATTGDPQYLYIFSGVGIFVLLIACINFINLSTARSALRAKEVGVRKVMGANRKQLMMQLFGESILTSLIAMIIAFVLLLMLVEQFGGLIGQHISYDFVDNISIITMLIGIGLLAGVFAGIYPALVLSAFSPTKVMKGLVTKGAKGALLRRGLIITQFGLSMLLLVSMMIVFSQIDYMKNVKLGFDKEQVVFVSLTGATKEKFDSFRNRLLTHTSIVDVSNTILPGRVGTSRGYNWPGSDGGEQGKGFYTMFVDPHALNTLGMELVDGRNFSNEFSTDETNAYILNETAVKEIGWDDPIGKTFRVWDEEPGQVVGVVNDFHFKSLHSKIEPLVLDIKPEWNWNAAIRVNTSQVQTALASIESTWKEFEPNLPFRYNFLDEDFDRAYKSEERLGELFGIFTFLAIFIACLGLLGLASFTTQQRIKEIGVRKVLGAEISDILILFSKEFSRLVFYSLVVAAPVAYYVMNKWLEDFAYRIDVGFVPFVLSGLIILVVALLTVSSQILRAARVNPASLMRTE